MKSEHRHDLQTNELSKWLVSLPEFFKQNQKMIIYIVVVAVLVIISAWFSVFRNRGEKLRQQASITAEMQNLTVVKGQFLEGEGQGGGDSSMAIANAVTKLKSSVNELSNDNLSALAMIKAADLTRSELTFKNKAAEKAVVENQIASAMGLYSKAAKKADDNKVIVAMAKYGLGLCHEQLGQFDEAGRVYAEIVADENLVATVAAGQAKARLKAMADYQGKVEFLPAPKVEPVKEAASEPSAVIEMPTVEAVEAK